MLLGACTSLPTPRITPELEAAMAFGTVESLHPAGTEVDENLILRLYAIPVFGESCFEETAGVCRKRYLLSVSSYDEQPEFGVFALPFSGQVTSVRWLADAAIDHAQLVFTVDRYTPEAVANRPALDNTRQNFRLRVSPKGIETLN
jgi:hypothetical protein